MKKIIFTLVLLISACTNIPQVDVLDNIEKSERNKACMDMVRFKVLQVFADGYALAYECNDGKFCYNNTIVLLTPQPGVYYYDDMLVNIPEEKCAIQDGVYRYETKNESIKTVPIIQYDYEYEAKNDEEREKRFFETMDNLRFGCKNSMTQDKKTNNSKSMKKCDCFIDSFITTYKEMNTKNPSDKEKDKVIENMLKNAEKKCGSIPDYLK